MDWITIIENLLPLVSQNVPAAERDAVFIQIVLELIRRIKSQSGMTTEQILDRAGATLDQNKIKLLQDMERLNAGGGAGGGGGTGGGAGGGIGGGTGGNP